jgi:hypothetical protein
VDFSSISAQNRIGKLLRFPLRFIPAETTLPILQGMLRGSKWISNSSTNGCWLGSYEYTKQKIMARTIQPGKVVYDVGAHVGFYTLLTAKLVGKLGR